MRLLKSRNQSTETWDSHVMFSLYHCCLRSRFRINLGTSLAIKWLRLRFPVQELQVQSLVGVLRFHTPCGQKTKTQNRSNTATAAAKSHQSCLTLCDPTDGSPPGFPVPGILQARTLEWVAISFQSSSPLSSPSPPTFSLFQHQSVSQSVQSLSRV